MYSGRTRRGGRRTFGTSGLLYRSNKLMWDRTTYSLWSNLTGEPVFGRLANSPTSLEILPMTLTTWGAWLEAHPDTTVMILETEYGARWNFNYSPGAADRARSGVSFPIWLKSDALDHGAEVYALRRGQVARAYPLGTLIARPLVHDSLGELEIVLMTDRESGEVRVYESGGSRFRLARAEQRERGAHLVDQQGGGWRREEEALVSLDGTASLPRVPGHLSLWFAWFGFFPHTTVWSPSP